MSMPTKGKQQHHLSHHLQHHQHQQQQQQQHHNPHQQHPLVVNVNVNQPGVHHLSQGYSAVVATNTQRYVSNAGSEFHVPAQNYGAQPGGQVGGGGGSVGVHGGRGPPPLGGIPTIGQSTAGIPPGGPAGGQAPPQGQAPGVQTQQTQGPAQTTTPPVHTPSPQEMGKQPHLQAHSYYPAAPRPQQPRSLNHRSGQGGSGNQVVGMPGVGGGGGQPPVMYATNLTAQPGTVYVPGHVAGLPTGPHQPSVFMNNQIIQFPSAPQRHQAQNQSFYPPYQPHALLAQNIYPYQPGPTPPSSFFYPSPSAPISLNRSSATAVSGGAQHVGGALGGAQGASMVPQGTLQQPTQQPQPLPQIDVYSGYNGGGTTGTSSSIKSKKPRGEKAITDIVNPNTGKNISHEIYDDDTTVESGASSNRETPQPQNSSGAEVVADFAARVAKAATESSDSGSPVAAVVTAAETFASQIATQSLSNIQQTNLSNDKNNQCNNNGPPTPTLQNISNVHTLCSQSSLDTTSTISNVTQIETISTSSSSPCPPLSSAASSSVSSSSSTSSAVAAVAAAAAAAAAVATAPSSTASSSSSPSSCVIKTAVESKPLQILAKEFQPRGEKKTVSSSSSEETVAAAAAAAVINIDAIPTTQPVATLAATPTPAVEQQETKTTTNPSSANLQTPSVLPQQQPQSHQHPHQQQHQHQHQHQQHQQHQHQHQQQHQHQHQQQHQQQQQPHSVPNTTTVSDVSKPPPSAAPIDNPVPTKEPFSNLSSKTTSTNSPPRRKSQSHNHGQSNNATEQQLPPPASSAKEQKEKKREKSLSSRGATPASAAHNQPDHHHHHNQKTNGDASADKAEQEPVVVAKNEVQQHKQNDGKAMQKQKNKNKLKPRDLNRKGAEKEGTDMDAFVNTVPPAKTEVKQPQDNKESIQLKDSNKEPVREITKETKEKDNYEAKKEKEVSTVHPKVEKHVIPDVVKETVPVQPPIIEKLSNEKEVTKEVSPKVEENLKSQNTCNTQIKPVPNDVVDHANVKEDVDLEAIVAQKNEENMKISAFQAATSEEKISTVPTVEKPDEQSEPQPPADTTATKTSIPLKYKYNDDQWSPINKSGKKVYDREFLIQLQDDPNSRIKPSNLPDLEVVLKESSKIRNSAMDLRPFKETNTSRPDALFPVFVKPILTARAPVNRKSHPGHPVKLVKPTKPHHIHLSLSLREDVKLRETENAWRPTRLKQVNVSEEEAKTEALYKKVRSVLNKLTPQKFDTLIEQVRVLQIDTQERLQGVINLVFEKAVDEPSFSVAYALMCKELGMMEATSSDKAGERTTESSVNFRKLIIGRCQQEFEKNTTDEVSKADKLKEIEECTDPEKKKDLQLALEEEERRIRIKSVGNIRFIGELYKQGMLTKSIMHRCIVHLLEQNDEDSFECLCKLLTTIGKDLESKGKSEEMADCFNKMQEIVSRRGQGKISSRIRFMLQDVIDLRANKWIPRRDDTNPKTIDQIQKEVESERLDTQLINTPLNTPRKDDRNSDRKRNRGFGPADEGGWSQPVSRTRQTYSVETAKLRNKPPPMDDLQLGSRNMYMWKNPTSSSKTINSNKFACLENISTLEQDKRMPLPLSGSRSTGSRDYSRDYKSPYDGRSSRNGSHQLSSPSSSRESSLLDNSQSQNALLPPQPMKSVSQTVSSTHKPPLTEEAFTNVFNSILKDYLREHILENAITDVKQTFDNTTFTKFVRESINYVLEKSPAEQERVSRLMSQLISRNVLPLQYLKAGFCEVLEIVDDLIIDIPKIWTYLAEVLTQPIKDEVMPLAEIGSIFVNLRSQGNAGQLLGELLAKLSREKGSKWIADKWDQSRLALYDIINPDRENVDKIIKEYHLEFLIGGYNSAKSSSNDELSLQQIHEHLRRLMKENTFDEISSWITENVGNRVKDPKFIRILMTAILETSVVSFNETWKLNENTLGNLELLINRFVDTDEVLELQCLYAIQAYMTKIEFPFGILSNIINKLSVDNIISSEAFLAWQKSDDPAEHEGHSVAIMTLTAFFTSLQEAEDSSSVEDGPSNINSNRC